LSKLTRKPNGAATSGQEPPKIEFPCPDYPVKVIAHNAPDIVEFAIELMRSFDPDLDAARVTHQDSRNGKFRSVRFFITAQSEAQLKAIYEAFKATGRVVTVL